MWNRAVSVMFFLMIILPACKSPASADHSAILIMVEGVVTNTKTGAPIADAVIQLAHYYGQRDFLILAEVSSDQEGRFNLTYEFHQCENVADLVLANAYGYRRFDVVNDSYLVSCTTDVQKADFQLDPL